MTPQQMPKLLASLIEHQDGLKDLSRDDAQWVIHNTREALVLMCQGVSRRNLSPRKEVLFAAMAGRQYEWWQHPTQKEGRRVRGREIWGYLLEHGLSSRALSSEDLTTIHAMTGVRLPVFVGYGWRDTSGEVYYLSQEGTSHRLRSRSVDEYFEPGDKTLLLKQQA